MLENEQCAELVNQVLSTCTFPDTAELEDQKCAICHDDSLGPNGTEKPAKLPCGHIVGVSCFMTWILKQIDDGTGKSYCPFCTTSFLDLPTAPNHELDRWIDLLAGHSLGNLGVFKHDDIRKIRRAEKLWDNLCSDILAYVEIGVSLTEIPLTFRTEEYLYGSGSVAEEFLSFGTVFHFTLQSKFELGRLRLRRLPKVILKRYDKLVEYLQADANRSVFTFMVLDENRGDMYTDETPWRAFDAYQGPNHLPEYRRRLEWCRWKLLEEARNARRPQA